MRGYARRAALEQSPRKRKRALYQHSTKASAGCTPRGTRARTAASLGPPRGGQPASASAGYGFGWLRLRLASASAELGGLGKASLQARTKDMASTCAARAGWERQTRDDEERTMDAGTVGAETEADGLIAHIHDHDGGRCRPAGRPDVWPPPRVLDAGAGLASRLAAWLPGCVREMAGVDPPAEECAPRFGVVSPALAPVSRRRRVSNIGCRVSGVGYPEASSE
ncbi:hypothetical protein B2J93_573 [Marssonina coronariae]|uniref:Uncharacterized protein n=1 Tax=Diplocarpon coronariae TaxID=2795749 RepID=A0A218ZBW7_9HELO|nr:hypothetical protein B2J93_573 [Marssonina coronariae]